MTRSPRECLPEQLARFVDDQLTDDEQLELEDHLATCMDCRVQLDSMSAESSVWLEARDFLSGSDAIADDEFDDEQRPGDERAVQIQLVLSVLGPTDDPGMLGRLGPYEITGVVGAGGMGVVLKGFDRALNRYVAIKVLAPHLAANGAARRRFAREAQAAAAVVHENVVAIHNVAEANQVPYFVMPYLRAGSLQKRLDELGVMEIEEVLRIAFQVATGLAAAHAQGLVHRDIKPANVLVEEHVERVKITDFGLARAVDDASLTRTGVIAGTPQYMSPEQARGDAVDHRSDLFSLGSLMYVMCTGRPPFRAETSLGVLRRICDTDPRAVRELNPAIPRWLESIIDRLLKKDPAQRFSSASELADLLAACLAHVQQPTVVPLPAAVPSERERRRQTRFWWNVGGGALLVACGSVAVWASGVFATGTTERGQANPLPSPAKETSPTESITPADADWGWEGALRAELQDLHRDTWLLEQDSSRSWD